MEVLALSRNDFGLLAARFGEHANSQRRMLISLDEAGATASYTRLVVLRKMEKQVGIDLGMVCWHFKHRHDEAIHPFETAIMNYVGSWRIDTDGRETFWVRLDRVREVREIVEEGRLVGEPEA